MQTITPDNSTVLLIPTCKGTEVVMIDSIIRVQASSNYSRLYFNNGKTLVVAKVLRWFENVLPVDQFLRTHRAHLVNRSFIQQVIPGEMIKIILPNGEYLKVSKRKKNGFIASWINNAA